MARSSTASGLVSSQNSGISGSVDDMAHYNQQDYSAHYADPYQSQAYPAQSNQPYYHSDPSFDQAPRYPDETEQGYQPEASTEKINATNASDDPYEPPATARAVPGRQGLRGPAGNTKSWAEMGPPPRSTGILRMWRKDERGKQWSKGGGLRTSLRFCFCVPTIAILIIISVILAIALYVRPPSVSVNDIIVSDDSVSLTTDGLSVSFSLNLSVANPNWFNVDFKEISATVHYPGYSNVSLGGGTQYNLDFKGYTDSTFQFPFTFNYTTSEDPNEAILKDLYSKCGGDGSTEDITIDYDLYLKLKVVGITVDPTISSSASFDCPISASDIEKILGGSL